MAPLGSRRSLPGSDQFRSCCSVPAPGPLFPLVSLFRSASQSNALPPLAHADSSLHASSLSRMHCAPHALLYSVLHAATPRDKYLLLLVSARLHFTNSFVLCPFSNTTQLRYDLLCSSVDATQDSVPHSLLHLQSPSIYFMCGTYRFPRSSQRRKPRRRWGTWRNRRGLPSGPCRLSLKWTLVQVS